MRGFYQLDSLFRAQQATAIGLTPDNMNVYQAACPVPSDSDAFLWEHLNQTPDGGPIQHGSDNTFFAAYGTLINALVAGSNPLDPIAAAKRNLAQWGDKPPAWNQGYKTMAKQLGAAPHLRFTFSVRAAEDPAVWGLWREADVVDGPSTRFAVSSLGMDTSFAHLLNFAPQPSDWYTSSAVTLAYQNPGKAPWNPKSAVTWETVFGDGGTLNRVITGLVCVREIEFSYVSHADYPAQEKTQIKDNASSGLWPYYLNGQGAETKVVFDANGAMTASGKSPSGKPTIIGATIQSAAQYFGGM